MQMKENKSGRRRHPSDIYKGLPARVSEYRYEGPRQVERILDYEYNLLEKENATLRYIVLFDAPWEKFVADSIRYRLKCTDSADFPTETVLLKLGTAAHVCAGAAFVQILLKKAVSRNIHKEFNYRGNRCVEGSTRAKEPDQSFYPAGVPPGRSNKWPSVVVEVGYNESLAKLSEDSRWWLTESDGDVKSVLTISLNKTRCCVVDLWKLQERKTRGHEERMVPAIDQHIVITKKPPESKTKASNTLISEYEDLVLRNDATNTEDFVFGKDDLCYLYTHFH